MFCQSIKKSIGDIIGDRAEGDHVTVGLDADTNNMVGHNLRSYIEGLEKTMLDAAANLEFEEAAKIRDEVKRLEEKELGIDYDPMAKHIGASAPKGRSTMGKPGTRQYRKKR
ncbi:MAG: UvrB/UvrC motif-containing protein, partial [Emcibacteraceae bacterium]|nr:UvrB/UvrC motif-containing protein [Emcibacteraceae bacterium]